MSAEIQHAKSRARKARRREKTSALVFVAAEVLMVLILLIFAGILAIGHAPDLQP